MTEKVRDFFIRALRITSKQVRLSEIINSIESNFEIDPATNRSILVINGIGESLVQIRRRTSDPLVFHQVFQEREYDTLVSLIKKFNCENNKLCVVDAGANVGYTSLFLMQHLQQAFIIAIEPSIENTKQCRINLKHFEGRMKIFDQALWSKSDVLFLDHGFRDGMEWSTQVTSNPTGFTSKVTANTLDFFLKEVGYSKPDILKIDIEGAEGELLSSEPFLKLVGATKFIAFEIHEECVDRISVITQLQKLGFTLVYKGETLFGYNEQNILLK